jgi:hypothetical protein
MRCGRVKPSGERLSLEGELSFAQYLGQTRDLLVEKFSLKGRSARLKRKMQLRD